MLPYLTIIRKAKLLKAIESDLNSYLESGQRSASVLSVIPTSSSLEGSIQERAKSSKQKKLEGQIEALSK